MSPFARIASAVLVGSMLFTAACDQGSRSKNKLVIGLDSEVERLDPLTIKNPKTFIVSWQIYQGLLGLDSSGSIAPAIAESWSTSDNKTWRFKIREGVYFHPSPLFGDGSKGRVVTTADVAASYTAFCGATAYPAFLLTDIVAGCADYNAGKASSVSGFRAIDDRTFEVELLKPEPFFPNRLTTAWIAVFPSEALDARFKDKWGLSLAVGTGPFRMVSSNDSEIRLARAPAYWDKAKAGGFEELDFQIVKNDTARLGALQKGTIDIMPAPTALYPTIFSDGGVLKPDYANTIASLKYLTFNSHMLGFNVTKLQDVNLRRAISHGIDRTRIVDTLFYGYAKVNGGAIPFGMNGYSPTVPADKLYNLETARAELAKSNYSGEEIELLVHDQAGSEQIGELIQSQLKQIGISIRLTKTDFNSAIGRMVKGDVPMFSMYFDYVFSAPELILLNMFDSAKRPVPNFWQFSDADVDARLEGLHSLPRAAALRDSAGIESAIVDQAPAAFLFQFTPVVLYRKNLPAPAINAHGCFDFAAMRTSP